MYTFLQRNWPRVQLLDVLGTKCRSTNIETRIERTEKLRETLEQKCVSTALYTTCIIVQSNNAYLHSSNILMILYQEITPFSIVHGAA